MPPTWLLAASVGLNAALLAAIWSSSFSAESFKSVAAEAAPKVRVDSLLGASVGMNAVLALLLGGRLLLPPARRCVAALLLRLRARRASPPRVAVLGCGKMGSGFVRRLRETGHAVAVWNRTHAVAAALAAEPGLAPCAAFERAEEACAAVEEGGLVLLIVADIAAVHALLSCAAVRACLADRVLVNLVSGNPDEGREIGTLVGRARYIDGAFAGSPAKARSGGGQLFVSSADGGALVAANSAVLGALGRVTYCGRVGAGRALDYAVVDLYFVNLLSYVSNSAMLAEEDVDVDLFAREAAYRLEQLPGFFCASARRMASRAEQNYVEKPSATLGTWRNFWASRLPYFEARGFPARQAEFAIALLDEAAGGEGGPHAAADVTRLQEVVRYAAGREGRNS